MTQKIIQKPTRPPGMSVRKWMKLNFNEHNKTIQSSEPPAHSSKNSSKLAQNAIAPVVVKYFR